MRWPTKHKFTHKVLQKANQPLFHISACISCLSVVCCSFRTRKKTNFNLVFHFIEKKYHYRQRVSGTVFE